MTIHPPAICRLKLPWRASGQSLLDRHTILPTIPLHTRQKPRPPFHHRPHHRPFHTSPTRHATPTEPTPYEILNLPPTCTASEIKRSFYSLSKTHHPDHNPQNQSEASARFISISSAYALIGTPAARERYDREHTRQVPAQRGGAGQGEGYDTGAPSGSGFGGRRASGLSRRRTQFRGPPPSFYRNGGYGAAAGGVGAAREAEEAARRAAAFRAQEEQARAAASGEGFAGQSSSSSYTQSTSSGSATGDTAWPFQTDMNDVPHFDREGHFRTTRGVEDQLRQGRSKRRQAWEKRREDAQEEYEQVESTADAAGRFVLYAGTLVVGIAGSSWLLRRFEGG